MSSFCIWKGCNRCHEPRWNKKLVSNELEWIAYMAVVQLSRTHFNFYSTPYNFVTRLLKYKVANIIPRFKSKRNKTQYLIFYKSCGHFHHFTHLQGATKENRVPGESSIKTFICIKTSQTRPFFYNSRNCFKLPNFVSK